MTETKSKKKHEGAKQDNKAISLLRKAYPIEEKAEATEIANAIYELYKNNDKEFAKEILKYVTRIDWLNKKHDFIYRAEKAMKAFKDSEFTELIEATKRELRGNIPIDNGSISIAYANKSRTAVNVSVSLWGATMVERLQEKQTYRVSSHTNSANGSYTVRIGKNPNCTCPDFVYRKNKVGGKCKHIYEAEAVEMALNMAVSQ